MKSTVLHIGEMAALTGVTVKTVLHYHKVGLLDEPQRTSGGYRLYGAAELYRMQSIKYLKSLGFGLDQIKEMLGKQNDPSSMRSVLESLRNELLDQMKTMAERLGRIEKLLDEEIVSIDQGREDPPTFIMMTEILGTKQHDILPGLMEQERSIYRVLDDFNWGMEHQKTYREVAEYLQAHPEHNQSMMEYNERMLGLMDLPEDSPEVDRLARECVDMMKDIPIFRSLHMRKDLQKPFEPVINEMLTGLLSPAQLRFCELCQQYMEAEINVIDEGHLE